MPLILNINDLRKALSNPIHPVYRGDAFKKIISQLTGRKIITVGDVVTVEYIKVAGVPPSIAFIDNVTKREEKVSSYYLDMFEDRVEIFNRRGEVDLELFNETLSQIAINFQDGVPTLVIVKGEEDLLTLAAPIFFSSPLSVLIYGQPNLGAVMLELFYPSREFLLSLLSQFSIYIGYQYDSAI